MRCKKLIAVLVAAIFLLGVCVPVFAGDGSKPRPIDPRLADHPWQDENTKDGGEKDKEELRSIVAPVVISIGIAIPVAGGLTKVLGTTGKPKTPKIVEKRK